jgi:adenosine deaminase
MSNTSMTKEFLIAVQEFNIALSDIEKLTINAMKSGFISFQDRLELIYSTIKPGFTALRTNIENSSATVDKQ